MHGIAKRIGAVAMTVLAIVMLLYAVSRLRGATPEQRAALKVMRSPAPTPGGNAFAALWLLRYDVPEAQLEAIADADVRRFASRPPMLEGVQVAPFHSVAAGRFDDLLAPSGNAPSVCNDGCLAQAREHLRSDAASMRVHSHWIQRSVLLSRYGHYRSRFAARTDMPVPDAGAAARTTLAHAVAFAQGRRHDGLTGVCRDADTWRRLVPNSDSLIVSMVAMRSYDRSLRLFADMLAELPAGHPLPAECGTAFAMPAVGETSLCTAMKGEFAFMQAVTRQVAGGARTALVFDREMTAAQMARNLVGACGGPAVPTRSVANTGGSWWRSLLRLECASNPVGCVLGDIAAPAYGAYPRRAADHAVRMQAGAALLRIHAGPMHGNAAAQDVAPELRIDAAARSLVFGLGAGAAGETQRLPLPSSRLASARAGQAGTQEPAPAGRAASDVGAGPPVAIVR